LEGASGWDELEPVILGRRGAIGALFRGGAKVGGGEKDDVGRGDVG